MFSQEDGSTPNERQHTKRGHAFRFDALLAVGVAGLVSAGCGALRNNMAVYLGEQFENTETFSRLFDADVQTTCEAARRALLSQGYQVGAARTDFISATKNFQPESEVHVQIVFNVVCTAEGSEGKVATAYVNALEERYVLKKSPNAASVGVAAIGSLSIPLSSTEESLVKVGSQTIPAGRFYDRFFALLQRRLAQDHGEP